MASVEQALEEVFFSQTPQRRLMEPQEVADCALYLVSDRAYALTGQAINLSAGWVMK